MSKLGEVAQLDGTAQGRPPTAHLGLKQDQVLAPCPPLCACGGTPMDRKPLQSEKQIT